MVSKPKLDAWQICKICIGAFGLQFGFALPQANATRIFQNLGASLDTVPLLWLAGPITGLIVQPLVGYYSDRTWTRFGRRRPYFLSGAAHFYDTYETRDGRWVAVGAIEPQFHALVLQRLGLDPAEFAAGVGFEGAPYDELVDEIWPALKRKLAAAIRSRTRDELQALFEDTDACVTPVLDLEEAATHRHQRVRGTYTTIDGHPQSAPGPRFSRSRVDAPSAPRTAGADADAVLAELGFVDGEVRLLRERGVLG